MNPRWIRRLFQLIALALVSLTPVISLWGVRVENVYNGPDMDRRYGSIATWLSETLTGAMGEPPHWVWDAVIGTPWSIRIAGLEFTDPLAAWAMIGGGAWPPPQMWIGVGLVLAVNVALGRFFCGYLCPYGILSRLLGRARPGLERLGVSRDWIAPLATRWVLLAAIGLTPMFGLSLIAWVLPYVAVGHLAYETVWGGVAMGALVTGVFLASDLLLWRHGVCRSICPSGALQRLTARFRPVRLIARGDAACFKGCNECAEACWLGLDPRSGRVGDDCDGCGRCIPSCPTTRLELGWQNKHARRAGTLLAAGVCAVVIEGCGTVEPPVLLHATAPWNSPFLPPDSPESFAEVKFAEWEHEGVLVGAGTARLDDKQVQVRFMVQQIPGEAYEGPLKVRISNASGELELSFAATNSPRSTPNRAFFEGLIEAPDPVDFEVVEGPGTGLRAALPL